MFDSSSSVSGRSGRTFGVSFALHVLGVCGLVLLGTVSQSPLNVTKNYRSVTIFAPTIPRIDEWRVPLRQRRRPVARPKRVRVAQPLANAAPVRKALAADPPKVRIEPAAPQAPVVAVRTPPPVPLPAEPPVSLVKTGLLASAIAPEIPITPRETIQAAGFGQASAAQEAKPSLSVPAGPSAFGEVAAGDGARWRNARYERPTEGQAGFGQARAGTKWTSGGKARSAGSSAAGFGEVKAGSGTRSGGATEDGPSKQAGFEEVVYSDDAKTPALPGHRARPARSVKIIAKPRPEYTTEARERKIEGEVQLEILFAASGDIDVLRVVQGLGYGLDENAIEAARKIRFDPALRDGEPVNLVATVHIRFQLAY